MPHKNIRKVVREVVEAIIEEFVNVLLLRCPTTEQGWKQLADDLYQSRNFPHIVGAIDKKIVAWKTPVN